MLKFFVSALLVLTAAVSLWGAPESGYEWRSFPDDKDQLSLWRDGRQIGNYRVSTATYYPRLGPERWGAPCLPPCPPPYRIEADGTLNYGLEVERVRPAAGKHQLNGRDVSREEVLEALGGPGVRDDRHQLCVTVIGAEAERQQVLDDLDTAPALAPWKGRLKVHGYEPSHWAVKDVGFKTE